MLLVKLQHPIQRAQRRHVLAVGDLPVHLHHESVHLDLGRQFLGDRGCSEAEEEGEGQYGAARPGSQNFSAAGTADRDMWFPGIPIRGCRIGGATPPAESPLVTSSIYIGESLGHTPKGRSAK